MTTSHKPCSLSFSILSKWNQIVKMGFLRWQVTVFLVHMWKLQSYAPSSFHESINQRPSNKFKIQLMLKLQEGIVTISNPSQPTERTRKREKMFMDNLLLLLSSWCRGKANYRVIEDDLFHRWSSVSYHFLAIRTYWKGECFTYFKC